MDRRNQPKPVAKPRRETETKWTVAFASGNSQTFAEAGTCARALRGMISSHWAETTKRLILGEIDRVLTEGGTIDVADHKTRAPYKVTVTVDRKTIEVSPLQRG